MPVIPGRSFALPTRATQPPAIVGSSCRSTRSTRMPLASVCSVTGTFWATAEVLSKPAIETKAADALSGEKRERFTC
jgi:hypothetical protein